MKKPSLILFVLLSVLKLPAADARASSEAERESRNIIPVCSSFIAYRYRDEVNLPGKSDKYKHCSLSCVMTIYCGPIGSLEVGALKELYDALGFGNPDIADLRADLKGIKTGLKIGLFQDRSRCYQACSTLFP
jgi:hypothetical protein